MNGGEGTDVVNGQGGNDTLAGGGGEDDVVGSEFEMDEDFDFDEGRTGGELPADPTSS